MTDNANSIALRLTVRRHSQFSSLPDYGRHRLQSNAWLEPALFIDRRLSTGWTFSGGSGDDMLFLLTGFFIPQVLILFLVTSTQPVKVVLPHTLSRAALVPQIDARQVTLVF
jgi:hypothetical protein